MSYISQYRHSTLVGLAGALALAGVLIGCGGSASADQSKLLISAVSNEAARDNTTSADIASTDLESPNSATQAHPGPITIGMSDIGTRHQIPGVQGYTSMHDVEIMVIDSTCFSFTGGTGFGVPIVVAPLASCPASRS